MLTALLKVLGSGTLCTPESSILNTTVPIAPGLKCATIFFSEVRVNSYIFFPVVSVSPSTHLSITYSLSASALTETSVPASKYATTPFSCSLYKLLYLGEMLTSPFVTSSEVAVTLIRSLRVKSTSIVVIPPSSGTVNSLPEIVTGSPPSTLFLNPAKV